MKNLIFTFFFLISTISIFAQHFIGTVLDKETNQPIQYAQIYLLDLKTGTTTDENGNFTIASVYQNNIPIQISYIGYQSLDEVIQTESTPTKIFYLEQGHFELEEVVIAVPTGKLQRDNIVNIEHINLTKLLKVSPISLSEAISNIPGVDQNTTGAGIGKPIIRGLSKNRIVTYAQGIRIENQQWGDEHGLGIGQIGIESIEIIKGPASVIYGSDALGGVLYCIDERYAQQNTLSGSIQSKYLSNTSGLINELGFKINKNDLKFNLFAAYGSHLDYNIPNSEQVFNTRFKEKNLKSSLGFQRKNWVSNLRYSFLENSYGIVEEADFVTNTDRTFILPFQNIQNHSLSFENTIYTGASKLSTILGYSKNDRKEFEDEIQTPALRLKLNTLSYNIKWHSPTYNNNFDFILGSQGMSQKNTNSGEEVLIPDAQTIDLGAFVLANFEHKALQFQAGLRIDQRNIDTKLMETDESTFPKYDNTFYGLTYSAGASYNLKNINWRLNVSNGFRAPTTSELLSDGVHEGTNRYEKGNINLKSEKATQFDLAFEYQNEHLNLSVNPFYNRIQNYIFLSPTAEIIDNNPVFNYNYTNAQLYGGEIAIHYHPHRIHWLHLESSFATVTGIDDQNNPLPLIPHAKINSTIKAEFSQTGTFSLKEIFIQHVHKLKQNDPGQFETSSEAYHLVHMGLNFDIKLPHHKISITTGINNLFNLRYIDHLSRFKNLNIPNQGRNFHIGIKMNWDKGI